MADLDHLLQELQDAQQPPQLFEDDNDDNDNDNEHVELPASVTNQDDNDDNDDNSITHGGHFEALVPLALQQATSTTSNNTNNVNTVVERLDLPDVVATTGNDNDNDDSDDNHTKAAFTALKAWWMWELQSPELHPWIDDVMQFYLHKLQPDDDDNEDNTPVLTNNAQAQKRSLLASWRRLDRQRTQFMVQHLLQTRLQKIQDHFQHYYQLDNKSANDDEPALLGPAERVFLQDYHAAWTRHMETTTTQHFPQSVWKALDEPDMVARPNVGQFVFCRVVASQLSLATQFTQDDDDEHDDNDDQDVELERYARGAVLILPYQRIRDLLRQGQVELFL